MSDYPTNAAWWMGKGFYDLLEALMERIINGYASNDVRDCWKWTYALYIHVYPHFRRLDDEKRKALNNEVEDIEDYLFKSVVGDKVSSLYDDPEEVLQNMAQMRRIMLFYRRLQELMDYHSMFMPKQEVIDDDDPEKLADRLERQL